MADVVFSIGSHPRLSRLDAFELADLLALRGTHHAVSASGKIGAQAEIDQEASTDIVLDRQELGELLALLQEPRYLEELGPFAHLRAEIAAELSSR